MSLYSYQDLEVWQISMELVVNVYQLTKLLPKEELCSLSDQMRRAAVSIPSNIAEGQEKTIKDFIRHLVIAKGSNAELTTQILICVKLDYLSTEQTTQIICLTKRIARMLNGLINSLTNKLN